MQKIHTSDGSQSAYNPHYGDFYHSSRDGAILETLYKYVFPCFWFLGAFGEGNGVENGGESSEGETPGNIGTESPAAAKDSHPATDANPAQDSVAPAAKITKITAHNFAQNPAHASDCAPKSAQILAPAQTLTQISAQGFAGANLAPLRILDLCFGLGYNALFTLAFAARLRLNVEIFAPEKDIALLENLAAFPYPKILQNSLDLPRILVCVREDRPYFAQNSSLKVVRGDAGAFLGACEGAFFDAIYQDAFSPSKNRELWSAEHFENLWRILRPHGVVSTYSSAANVRQNAAKCGFLAHEMKFLRFKKGSIFSKRPLDSRALDGFSGLRVVRLV